MRENFGFLEHFFLTKSDVYLILIPVTLLASFFSFNSTNRFVRLQSTKDLSINAPFTNLKRLAQNSGKKMLLLSSIWSTYFFRKHFPIILIQSSNYLYMHFHSHHNLAYSGIVFLFSSLSILLLLCSW